MDRNRRRFDQHALVEGKTVHHEESRIRTDFQILGIVAVQVGIVVREQAVHAAMLAEVGARRSILAGAALAARDHAGHDPVADLDRKTGGVMGDVLAEHFDHARTFMTEHHRAETERIAFIFMAVGAADAAPFHLDQHLIVADRRNREFLDFKFAGSDQHRSFRHLCHDYTSLLMGCPDRRSRPENCRIYD